MEFVDTEKLKEEKKIESTSKTLFTEDDLEEDQIQLIEKYVLYLNKFGEAQNSKIDEGINEINNFFTDAGFTKVFNCDEETMKKH